MTRIKRLVAIQWHTDTINKPSKDPAGKYYDSIKDLDGYEHPDGYWEIPLWAAMLARVADINGLEFKFVLAERPDKVSRLFDWNEFDVVCGSVLDVNRSLWYDMLSANSFVRFDLGGYVDPNNFYSHRNMGWHDSMKSFSEYYNLHYDGGTDYWHFRGQEVIPRLKLSEGCRHHCKFCTIANTVTEINPLTIWQQVSSFMDLRFRYIYIDDKTFGQAGNHVMLKEISQYVRSYNPRFLGFIVQTTAAMIKNKDTVSYWKHSLNVHSIEIGVETYNDPILRSMRKPASENTIKIAVDNCSSEGIRLIPNIIIGFQGETERTYERTIKLLSYIYSDVHNSHANIYTLAVYDDSELSLEIATDQDSNELQVEKSYNTDEKNHIDRMAYEIMCDMSRARILEYNRYIK